MHHLHSKITTLITRVILIFCVILLLPVVSVAAQGISSDDLQSIDSQTPFYDPNATQNNCASNSSDSTNGGSSSITGSGAWNANVQPPYYLEQFIINVLEDIATIANLPKSDTVTQEHVVGMVAWAYAEGGNIENTDIFNIWNTGLDDPALLSSTPSGNGVQSFKSFDAGVTAAAVTMTGSNQNRLEQVLTQPNTTAEQFVQALTYYQNYPGNQAWAQADTDNQQAYYNTLSTLVSQTRANYAEEASVEIGPGQEDSNHVPASELMFNGGSNNPTSPASNTAATTSSSGCTNGGATGGSVSCTNGTTVSGNAAIACDVLKYGSIKYSQAGHLLPTTWHQECPTIGPSCATDCSGLVSIAIYDVFGLDKIWTTYSMLDDKADFEVISLSQAKPGDLVEPNPDHVEVIESVQGNTLNDFAAHTSHPAAGSPEVGADTITAEPGFVYLRYIGQGASTSNG